MQDFSLFTTDWPCCSFFIMIAVFGAVLIVVLTGVTLSCSEENAGEDGGE
jgi:hypothetical protein